MEKMSELLEKINSQMHEGRCPQSGSIGECAAMDETMPGVWWAALYIWDNDFNDSTRVAKWFHDAGAADVLVSHVLYDSANDDRDGRCLDGVRPWHVQFSMPQSATTMDKGTEVNYCETCKNRDKDRHCQSEKLAEEWAQTDKEREDMLLYNYDESGSFWVGPKFGCVHHAPNTDLSNER